MNNCLTCGGLIMEPNKVYGYAGPVCNCIVMPKIQRPMIDNGFNFYPSNAIIGVDKKHYDDLVKELNDLKAKYQKAVEALQILSNCEEYIRDYRYGHIAPRALVEIGEKG